MMMKAFIFYELQSTTNLDKLIASLKEGIKNAVDQFPFMAGNLQVDNLGKPCIVTLPEKQLELSIRHFAGTEYKHFSALAKDSFPPNNLDHTKLLPEWAAGQQWVCALQLNIIVGGLILGCAMHHTVGDWTSMDTFLATACRGSKAYHHNLKMPVHSPDFNKTPYSGQAPPIDIPREDLLERCPNYYIMDLASTNPIPFANPSSTCQTKIYQIAEPEIQQIQTAMHDSRRCELHCLVRLQQREGFGQPFLHQA